jgi:hypothetical protein
MCDCVKYVKSTNKKTIASLSKDGYLIIDLSKKTEWETFRKLHPFWCGAMTVWEHSKVFEHEGTLFMTNTKTKIRKENVKRGKFIGWSFQNIILDDEHSARLSIFAPCYQTILEKELEKEIVFINALAIEGQRLALVYDDSPQYLNYIDVLKQYFLF